MQLVKWWCGQQGPRLIQLDRGGGARSSVHSRPKRSPDRLQQGQHRRRIKGGAESMELGSEGPKKWHGKGSTKAKYESHSTRSGKNQIQK